MLPVSNERKKINDNYVTVVPTVLFFIFERLLTVDRAHPPKKMFKILIFPFLLRYHF